MRRRKALPAMVASTDEDGLYVARHVVGAGWLQVGKRRPEVALTTPPRELP